MGRRSSSVRPTYTYRSLSCSAIPRGGTVYNLVLYPKDPRLIHPLGAVSSDLRAATGDMKLPRLAWTAGSSPFAARWIFQNETPGSPSWESQFRRSALLVIKFPLPGTGCSRVCGRRREKTGEGIGGCCRQVAAHCPGRLPAITTWNSAFRSSPRPAPRLLDCPLMKRLVL